MDRNLHDEEDWLVCAKWAWADMKAREAFFDCDTAPRAPTNISLYLHELLLQGHQYAFKIVTEENFFAEGHKGHVSWFLNYDDSDKHGLLPGHIENACRAIFIYAYSCASLPISAREVKETPRHENYERSAPGGPPKHLWRLPPTLDLAISDATGMLKREDLRSSSLPYGQSQVEELGVTGRMLWATGQWLALDHEAYFDPHDKHLILRHLQRLAQCTLMAGIMHRRLEFAIDQEDFSTRVPRTAEHPMRPPLVTKIPFWLFCPRDPPPFTRYQYQPTCETRPFLMRNMPSMTSPTFLTDGEWIGYYTWSLRAETPDWLPMMHDIFFEVTGDTNDHVILHSKGQDADGQFTLGGTINRTHGRVQLRISTGNVASDLKWAGFMTAFGIIGRGDHYSTGGWLWLWKKAWSQRGNAEEDRQDGDV